MTSAAQRPTSAERDHRRSVEPDQAALLLVSRSSWPYPFFARPPDLMCSRGHFAISRSWSHISDRLSRSGRSVGEFTQTGVLRCSLAVSLLGAKLLMAWSDPIGEPSWACWPRPDVQHHRVLADPRSQKGRSPRLARWILNIATVTSPKNGTIKTARLSPSKALPVTVTIMATVANIRATLAWRRTYPFFHDTRRIKAGPTMGNTTDATWA